MGLKETISNFINPKMNPDEIGNWHGISELPPHYKISKIVGQSMGNCATDLSLSDATGWKITWINEVVNKSVNNGSLGRAKIMREGEVVDLVCFPDEANSLNEQFDRENTKLLQ